MIFQIFLIVFAIFALAKTARQYKHKKVSVYWFVIWTLFWLLGIAIAFAPQTTDVVAKYVGVEKGADLIVYTAIVILFYALYRNMVRMEKYKQELTELVRKVALLEAKKKKE